MKEINSYCVFKLKNGNYALTKVLGEYETERKADDNLIRLTTGEKTEKQLLKEYTEAKGGIL